MLWLIVFSFRITIYFLPIFFTSVSLKLPLLPSVLEDYNVVLPVYIENIFFLAVKFTGQCKKGYSKEIAVEWKIKILCSIWAKHTSRPRFVCYRKGSDPMKFTKLNFWNVWHEAKYQGFNLLLGGRWMEQWFWKAFCLFPSFLSI